MSTMMIRTLTLMTVNIRRIHICAQMTNYLMRLEASVGQREQLCAREKAGCFGLVQANAPPTMASI